MDHAGTWHSQINRVFFFLSYFNCLGGAWSKAVAVGEEDWSQKDLGVASVGSDGERKGAVKIGPDSGPDGR